MLAIFNVYLCNYFYQRNPEDKTFLSFLTLYFFVNIVTVSDVAKLYFKHLNYA